MFEKAAADFTERYTNHSVILSEQRNKELDRIHALTTTINSKEFLEQFRNFIHGTLEHIREYVAAIFAATDAEETNTDPVFARPVTVVYKSRNRRLSLTDGKWVWESHKEMQVTLMAVRTGIAVAEWKGMVPDKYPDPLPPKSVANPQIFRAKPNGIEPEPGEIDMFQHIEEYLIARFTDEEPDTVRLAEIRVETIDLADHLLTTIGNAFDSFGNAILPLLFKRRNDSLRELTNIKQVAELGIDFVRKSGVLDQADLQEHRLLDMLIGGRASV